MMAFAQATAQAAPAFEVASLRLTDPKSDGNSGFNFAGANRFTATRCSVWLLLELAYGVDEYQIQGLPKWADATNYDVSAKAEGDLPLSHEQMKPLLQQLLAERLQVKVHHETRQMKGYALVVSKGGPKLKAGSGETGGLYILQNGLRGQAMSLETLAHMLIRSVGHPVVDKTGVVGKYDVKLDFAPINDPDSTLPSLFTALDEQMGLRLEPQMVPVDVLVVDHVERVPPEN